ncbi:MAG: 3-dehydroquinate synthase [Planctomycetaceae bacterium]
MTKQVSQPGIDYSVVISPNLMQELPARFAKRYPDTHAVLLTDNRVWDLYGSKLAEGLIGCGVEVDDIIIPEGEASKSLDVYSGVIEELHHHRFDEDSVLINLGGGVVTDLGGFVAASYREGVRSVLVPTTLVGQQEAAFSTRVGINTDWSKNFIGSPRRPDVVYSDPTVLGSLRRRDLASGLAATLKIAMAHDFELFELLEFNVVDILDLHDANALHELVLRASAARLRSEPYEGRGLGIAFAHALESTSRYSGVLHGEAIAWGIAIATAVSGLRRLMKADAIDRVFSLMAACELPPELPSHVLQSAVDAMDLGPTGQLVLPVTIGKVTSAVTATAADVHAAVEIVRHHPAFSDIRPDYRSAA